MSPYDWDWDFYEPTPDPSDLWDEEQSAQPVEQEHC